MTTPSLFEEGDAVRVKLTVDPPYRGKVGVVKEVSRHEGVLVELGSELASWRFKPNMLAHTAPNNVPDDVWSMIKPPEPVHYREPELEYETVEDWLADPTTLVIAVRVPADDLGEIDFTDTIAVLDYLAERHEDLSIEPPESNQ